MASELENALKNVANQIAVYVKGAAELRVETRVVEIAAGANQPAVGAVIPEDQEKPGQIAALTIVQLDGDSTTAFPVRQNANNQLEVDTELFEMHQRNVSTAIEYRSSILNALLGLLQPRNKQL